MQKHQEWLENRSYQQHLECLKKIKARKNFSANFNRKYKRHDHSIHSPRDYQNKQNRVSDPNFFQKSREQSHDDSQEINQIFQTDRKSGAKKKMSELNDHDAQEFEIRRQKINCLSSRNTFQRTQNFFNRTKKFGHMQRTQVKDLTNISLKDQELLWNNFLLGKRILETSPVICKRKLDIEYQKHKELVRSMTIKKSKESADFRLKKLQQHNNRIYRISDDHRIQNNLHKQYMVNLIIQSIQFFKFKFSSFENVILVMKYGYLDSQQNRPVGVKKRTKQVSECISSAMLTSYNFFFTLKKKRFQQNIKNVKSLNVISIGTFSFQFDGTQELTMQEANLFNFGKFIGIVKFSAHFGKKSEFLSNIE